MAKLRIERIDGSQTRYDEIDLNDVVSIQIDTTEHESQSVIELDVNRRGEIEVRSPRGSLIVRPQTGNAIRVENDVRRGG